MSTPKFADVYNLVAFLSKPTVSEGFEQIIDFLKVNPIKYALMVNPTIYTSCIEQFWATATTKNINREAQIHAKVDGKKVIISEATIRRDLKFKDKGGVDCLSNEVIFEQILLIGGRDPAYALLLIGQAVCALGTLCPLFCWFELPLWLPSHFLLLLAFSATFSFCHLVWLVDLRAMLVFAS
nr:hypothetical protein [Tanacetum cinerariifolium]